MRTLAVINQKGGCGKTTTAINLAAGLARRGFRTLLIDLDPQSHCAAGLGVPEDRIDLDISDALRTSPGTAFDRERLVWRVARGLDLVPSRMKLAGLESARGGLADTESPETRLDDAIRMLAEGPDLSDPDAPPLSGPRYDAVVIDCPPSIGLLSYNALAAAGEVLIPVETSYFSLRGAGKQIQTARSVARHVGKTPRVRLLATMFDPQLPLARDLLDDLRDRFGAAVIPTTIRMDPDVKESASFGRPVEDHAPDSMGACDYASLSEWVIEHADLDRPEPGTDPESLPAAIDQSTLPEQTLEARPSPTGQSAPGPSPAQLAEEIRASAGATLSASTTQVVGEEPALLSRAEEIARRAVSLAEQQRSMPIRRSLMPHKPIALELVEPETSPVPSTPAASLRHLWGVRAVDGGLLFVQPVTAGRSVAIAGDFNGWDPQAGQMTRRDDLGILECRFPCGSGRFQYRLVVEGDWQCDPYNPSRVPNGLGGENNLAVV